MSGVNVFMDFLVGVAKLKPIIDYPNDQYSSVMEIVLTSPAYDSLRAEVLGIFDKKPTDSWDAIALGSSPRRFALADTNSMMLAGPCGAVKITRQKT